MSLVRKARESPSLARDARALVGRLLWPTQALLAALFVFTGISKLIHTPAELVAAGRLYAAHLPGGFIHAIAVAELVGALGLVLPAALRVRPGLTPLAAALLALVMAGAVATHVILDEWHAIALPAALCVACAVVAAGRARWWPIAAR
ncbi:MAG: DoxX family protein [bacterium]